MKVPDISRIAICRIQLRELTASKTGETQSFDCAGEYLKRIRQVGFNGVVLGCGDFIEGLADPVHDVEKLGQAAVSDDIIRSLIRQAHQLEMMIVLELESLPQAGARVYNGSRTNATDWCSRVERLLRTNRDSLKAEGFWLSTAAQAGVNSAVEEAPEVRASRLTELQALAARYPATLLVVDRNLSDSTAYLSTPCPAPNVIFSDSSIASLLADWRLHGTASVDNLDELAAALGGTAGNVQEDSKRDVEDEAPDFIINDLSMTGHPPLDPQADELDRVYTALILTAPGIPMLSRIDGVSHLAPLLELRQNRRGNSRGLQGKHIRIIHKNDAGRVLAYLRWDRDAREDGVIVLINFTEDSFRDYTLGLPLDSNWQLQVYGDASAGVGESLQFSEEEYFPEPASLTLDLAPHSYLILTRAN